MDPFTVMKARGKIVPDEMAAEFDRKTTYSGTKDDYDLASGPSRTLTARSDKAMSTRDYRMPTDLARSRRVGLSRTICIDCGAIKDQGRATHAADCLVGVHGPAAWLREVTGPMSPNETSADVGWR